MTYLDHAATTPLLPEVLAAMTEQLGRVGNASSLHASGRAARRVAEQSRERLAEALGARPSEVLFTGGGTESDNLAIKGIYWARRRGDAQRRRLMVSAVEHHAVLDAAQWLADNDDAELVVIPVDADGALRWADAAEFGDHPPADAVFLAGHAGFKAARQPSSPSTETPQAWAKATVCWVTRTLYS